MYKLCTLFAEYEIISLKYIELWSLICCPISRISRVQNCSILSDTPNVNIFETREMIETKWLRNVRSWILVYLPHGWASHVSHEIDIILLYRRSTCICVPTLYIRRIVGSVSPHTREKKTARNRIHRRKRKKKFTKPIKMPTALSSTLRTTTINVKSIVNRNSRALITRHRQQVYSCII